MFNNIYNIIKEEGNHTVIQLDKDNVIFKVHFEGNPILPGACMTEISRELIERRTKQRLNIKNIKSIKFLQLVSPQQHIEILFDINIVVLENNELQAKINVCDLSVNQTFAKINMILGNA